MGSDFSEGEAVSVVVLLAPKFKLKEGKAKSPSRLEVLVVALPKLSNEASNCGAGWPDALPVLVAVAVLFVKIGGGAGGGAAVPKLEAGGLLLGQENVEVNGAAASSKFQLLVSFLPLPNVGAAVAVAEKSLEAVKLMLLKGIRQQAGDRQLQCSNW